MITTTQEKDKVTTAAGTLDALNFDAALTPIFDDQGHEIEGFKRVYRPDRDLTLSVVSDQYKLVQHKEAMEPAIEVLGREGWKVQASRIEKSGSKAYVELVRKDAVSAEVTRVVGEKVGERLMLRNSYDKTSSLSFTMGAVVLVCTNGLTMPGKGGLSFNGHHTGDLRNDFNGFLKNLGRVESALASRMIEHYSHLDKVVPNEIGQEITKRAIGERNRAQALHYWTKGIGRDGNRTAWNLYNGITQYLSHDFKGGWDRRELLNVKSFDLIAGYVKTGTLPKVDEAQS